MNEREQREVVAEASYIMKTMVEVVEEAAGVVGTAGPVGIGVGDAEDVKARETLMMRPALPPRTRSEVMGELSMRWLAAEACFSDGVGGAVACGGADAVDMSGGEGVGGRRQAGGSGEGGGGDWIEWSCIMIHLGGAGYHLSALFCWEE